MSWEGRQVTKSTSSASKALSCAAQTSPPPLSPSLLPSSAGAPELRAQLTPREYTTLSSEMAGRIDHVGTRVGEHFRKDDVLVVFDCAQPRVTALPRGRLGALNEDQIRAVVCT